MADTDTSGISTTTGGAASTLTPGTTTTTSDPLVGTGAADTASANVHREEAKSRFSAALDEAKAGAAALKAEAGERASAYKTKAKVKGEDYKGQARLKGGDAKMKGKEYAVEGKAQASKGLRALSDKVNENAYKVDEKLGSKYGDYARSASSSLTGYADKLDQKSVDELTEDAREFVRQSPGLAVGLAAVAGFMVSSLFRR